MRVQSNAIHRQRFATACWTLIAIVAGLGLQSPCDAATYTVTGTNDSGPGSLRQAIYDANGSAGLDSIRFSIPGAPPHTIRPDSVLPIVTDAVVIDGWSQPGYSGTPCIELDGSNVGTTGHMDGVFGLDPTRRCYTSPASIRPPIVSSTR